MFANLALGAVLISATVLIQTFGLITLSNSMPHIIARLHLHRHGVGKALAMIATVLGLFLIHTIEIWAWAVLFIVIGAIGNLEDALYFSTATFSTTGGGDVGQNPAWRLLSSLEGINGFLLIGWSIAYLVAASMRYGPFRSGEHF